MLKSITYSEEKVHGKSWTYSGKIINVIGDYRIFI